MHLNALIENHVIVDPTDSDEVRVGSVVEIRYDGDDDTERFLIGSIEERGSDLEVMSPGSPLGSALLGKKVGDKAAYTTPTGAELTVEVAGIS